MLLSDSVVRSEYFSLILKSWNSTAGIVFAKAILMEIYQEITGSTAGRKIGKINILGS